MTGRHASYDRIKRVLDVLAAALLLVFASPLLAVIAILVATKLGRPVLFRQVRPGLHGRLFTLLKFRSMRDSDPARGLVSDADRLTAFGARLRSTSLDELPTLWNVLCGDMSMVGPRPLLVEYLDRYTPEQSRRHEVRPGVTGLAQVGGRNAIDWDERFVLDVRYVDERGPGLDARILAATVRVVLFREGISQDGHVTMSKFGEDDDA
jgi:lipopolysaccharide/colanic/teichoic acid biosynthesis glycosyltransferase